MYATIAPPGPACEIDAPDATNRPVPIEPPMAIIVSGAPSARDEAGWVR